MGIAQYRLPRMVERDGVRLGTPNHSVRVPLVIRLITQVEIIVANDIQRLHVLLCPIRPACRKSALADIRMPLQEVFFIVLRVGGFRTIPHAADTGGHKARAVPLANRVRELSRPQRAV